MAGKQMNGDEVAHGEVKSVTYDRPYRTYWNPYGKSAYLPADPIQMSLFMEGGWMLHKPTNPLPEPTSRVMADGTIYEYASSANEVSEVEMKRMQRNPSEMQAAATPTATYYSANGDVLEGLPADPKSMKEYLELGLSLTPPFKTEVEPAKLRAV